jgi:pimeloyl-ACP methyl ester carboxylesterase
MPGVNVPETRYATTEDDVHIAYQVLGNGPIDVVFVHAFVSHVELFWELPSYARFLRELSSWGRAIVFDKRGVGLSDRLSVVPTLEARIDDLRAVLDAVESERILVVGNSDGGALAAMFAATYPERTLGLVLWSGGVRVAWAPDYPWGMREEAFEERLSTRMELWGDEERRGDRAHDLRDRRPAGEGSGSSSGCRGCSGTAPRP